MAEITTVIREGPGLGDLVMVAGGVQALRKKFPDREIRVIASYPLSTVLEGHPDIDQLGTRFSVPAQGQIIDLSADCPSARYESVHQPYIQMDRIELFAKAMGVAPEVPRLFLSDDEQMAAKQFFARKRPRVGPGRVGLVLRSAEMWRNYPFNSKLAERLSAIGLDVVILDHQQIIDGFPNTNGFSLREITAVISQCNVVVTPDTGWLHVAAALGRPVVGLFGSIDPELRLSRYEVPGRWLTHDCPYQRQPCWYDICAEKDEIQPCMRIEPEKIVNAVIECLQETNAAS